MRALRRAQGHALSTGTSAQEQDEQCSASPQKGQGAPCSSWLQPLPLGSRSAQPSSEETWMHNTSPSLIYFIAFSH